MKLIAQVKLNTTPEQSLALLATLERANDACNALSQWAWQQQVFGQFALHKEQYSDIRARFALTAQIVVRCIAKVADAYKLDKATQRTFQPHGSIAYDDRILRWYVERRTVSVWTLQGRITVGFSCGSPSAKRHLSKARRRQSRFVTWVNHSISKQLVQTALSSAKAIALEDLNGIRQRVSASRQMRWLLGNWAFHQLRRFAEYKAKRAGVPVLIVEAAYSSQTCSKRRHCERANRRSQAGFHCVQYGFQCNADFNAALNLKARGELVSRPMVSALV